MTFDLQTDDERKRFEMMRQWSRAELLKLCRSIGMSAHRLKDNDRLAYQLIAASRWFQNDNAS